MATGKRFYWMKLKESFMTSDTIDYFMSQPDGANYVVLYQMLCLKTINTDGRLSRRIGEVVIKYDIPKIQRDLKWFSADTIRVALNLYKSFGLVYEDVDGALVLADHNNLVGSETDYKEQKAKQRIESKNRPKLLGSCKRVNSNTVMLPSGHTQYVDEKRYGGNGMLAFDLANGVCEMCGAQDDLVIHHNNGYSNDIEDLYVLCRHCHGIVHSENGTQILQHRRCGQVGGQVHTEIEIRDRDKEIRDKITEIDGNITVSNDTVCWTKDVQRVLDAWNSLGLNKIQKISKDTNRGKMLNARLKEYGTDTVVQAIERIRKSSFLKGQNRNGWTIVFDWFIKPNNFIKVMEGNYDDSTGSTQPPLNQSKNMVQTDYGSPEDFYK